MQETLRPFSSEASRLVVGAIYEHYKGLLYQVLAIARHSETLEECVVYKALYGSQDVWVRPLAMFLETVLIEGNLLPRFRPVLN